jgi:hypothetical protein
VNDDLKVQYQEGYTKEPKAIAEMVLLEQSFHESIRLAQQSLTLRLVLKPITIQEYTVVPGIEISLGILLIMMKEERE